MTSPEAHNNAVPSETTVDAEPITAIDVDTRHTVLVGMREWFADRKTVRLEGKLATLQGYVNSAQASLDLRQPAAEYNPLANWYKKHRSVREGFGFSPEITDNDQVRMPVDLSTGARTKFQTLSERRNGYRVDAINKLEQRIREHEHLFGVRRDQDGKEHGLHLRDRRKLKRDLKLGRYTRGEAKAIKSAGKQVRKDVSSVDKITKRLESAADGGIIGNTEREIRVSRAERKVENYKIKMRTKQIRREWREDDRAAGNTRWQHARESMQQHAADAKENVSTNAAFAEAYYQGVVGPKTRQAREDIGTTVDYARAYFGSRPGRAQRQAERAARETQREADRLSKLPPPPSPEGPDTPPSPTDTTPPPKPKTGPSGAGGAIPIGPVQPRSSETTPGSTPGPVERGASPETDEVAKTTSRLRSTIANAVKVGAKVGKDAALVGGQIFLDEVRSEMRDGKPVDARRLTQIAKELSLDPRILGELAGKTTARGTAEDTALGSLARRVSENLEASRRTRQTTRRGTTGTLPTRSAGRPGVVDTTATDK